MKSFRNALPNLNALAEYIVRHFTRPRICIASNQQQVFFLLSILCDIPDAEVMFVSDTGYSQYQLRMSDFNPNTPHQRYNKADLLAKCAEHMI